MTRFSPGFVDAVCRETPPWDIGAPQPALLALVDQHPSAGPVLDVGCGSGDLAVALARRGLQVLGIDMVEAAVGQACEGRGAPAGGRPAGGVPGRRRAAPRWPVLPARVSRRSSRCRTPLSR